MASRRLAMVALTIGIAGCSSTPGLPGFGGDETAAFCKAARKLPDVATDFADVSVEDPEEFEAALREAVDRYLDDLDVLASKAPAEIEKQISVLRSAVDQYKFADAIDAKEPIDIYVAEHCAVSNDT